MAVRADSGYTGAIKPRSGGFLPMFRPLIALPLLLAAAPSVAQVPAPAPNPAPAPAATDEVPVVITTDAGTITVALDRAHAPLTTANFLRYVDAHRLDGTVFYRSMKLGPDLGVIQGGTRSDPKRVFPPVAHEPTTQTGLHHIDGTISMPRYAPGTATGDFFITVGAIPSLDADPAKPGDNQGFAAFGHVTAGMDVVHRILDDPTSPTEGEGVMKGQMLSPTVRIVSVRRVASSAPGATPPR